MKIVLDMPFVLPSLNRQWREHWSKRAALKLRCQQEIIAALPPGERAKGPRTACRLRIHRYAPRLLDFDNLVGAHKVLIDSFVELGLIADDKPAVIGTPTYIQQTTRGAVARTVVTIEDMEEHAHERD